MNHNLRFEIIDHVINDIASVRMIFDYSSYASSYTVKVQKVFVDWLRKKRY
jgi:hypothetical protein